MPKSSTIWKETISKYHFQHRPLFWLPSLCIQQPYSSSLLGCFMGISHLAYMKLNSNLFFFQCSVSQWMALSQKTRKLSSHSLSTSNTSPIHFDFNSSSFLCFSLLSFSTTIILQLNTTTFTWTQPQSPRVHSCLPWISFHQKLMHSFATANKIILSPD